MPEYTTTEIAALCKVSERTIQRWMKDGRLPAQELKRNLFHVSDEDIARLQPRGVMPPENERIAMLEQRVGELEDRLGMIEHLYTLEHQKPTYPQRTSPRPVHPQKQASEGDTLPVGYAPIFDLIKRYNLLSKRNAIMRYMRKYGHLKTGHWKVAGHEVKHCLDQEGVKEFMEGFVTQA